MAKARKKAARSSRRGGPRKRSAAGERGVGKNLVVVESPAKARTINRYLGSDYVVRASMGHVRDLPQRDLGVDLDHDFQPTYQPLSGRRKVLADLKRYAKAAPQVFLATDLDREGEAIAWHLAESLGVDAEKIRRVLFNEITASAIRQAFAHPHRIDMNKVNAQQARRVLDRIVGYKLSPLLWRKVAAGLSAGRVQSVAVRLIVEREREIDEFEPEEYWRIGGVFTPDGSAAPALAEQWAGFLAERDEKGNPPSRDAQKAWLAERGAFQTELMKLGGSRFQCNNADRAVEVVRALGCRIEHVRRSEDAQAKGAARHRVEVVSRISPPSGGAPPYVVRSLQQRDSRSRPPAPFTTASLQQAASVQLRFGAARTMRLAQQLYEGVDVPGEGSVGLITYMRTDSTHLSREALEQVRAAIGETFGEAYVPQRPNFFAAGKRAQEAHEAIRPTDVRRTPGDLRSALSGEQRRLYELIWKRFVACQMPPARWKVTEADIVVDTAVGEAVLRAIGRRLVFDGFLRVAGMPRGGEQILPELEVDREVWPVDVAATQRFTQPPPRYTEASLVKALEADGIGRPSTYAAIIQTIQAREYVRIQDRTFRPTDLGMVVTDKLVKHFPRLFDVRFTAHMEDQLDEVEAARADWVEVLRQFYEPFEANLKRAAEQMVHAKAETQPSEYTCPACGKEMVYRFSRSGRYLACTGYPACRQTFPVDAEGRIVRDRPVDIACPKCGKAMVLRRGRYGPFLSCATYPQCDGVVNLDKKGRVKLPAAPPLEIELKCPQCGSALYLRRGRRGPWLSCSKYPKCRGRLAWKSLPDDQREDLDKRLTEHEAANPQPVIRTLDGKAVEAGYEPQERAPADGEGPRSVESDQEDKPPF